MRRRTPRPAVSRSTVSTISLAAAAVFALTAGPVSPAATAAPATAAPATATPAAVEPAAVEPLAAAANDYCEGQCDDILPPGTDGGATLAEILAHRLLGTKPAHSDDQLGPYDALTSGYPGLTDDTLSDFFADASLAG